MSGRQSTQTQRQARDKPVSLTTYFQCFLSLSLGRDGVEEPGRLLPVSQMRKLKLKVKVGK